MFPETDPSSSAPVCVVTGASAGIGRAAALELARQGARVIMAVRNLAKGEAVRRKIVEAGGNEAVELALVDLSRQDSIRSFAHELGERHPRLDVLVNNAGIWSNRRRTSPDGIELTWATNVLGYVLTTELLLPRLETAGRARIVNVASRLAGELDLEDVQFERRPYTGRDAYAQSKQANRMLTWALARRLEETGITANALHPGFVSTEIFGKGGGLGGLAVSLWAKLRARTPAQGADTAVWLAVDPVVEGKSGVFWVDREEHPCRFRDEAAEEELWSLCRRMCGLDAGGAPHSMPGASPIG
jgi:NAD(P)-dependent dehydrogenase (short-subunit alcohol dehydrogenase family)